MAHATCGPGRWGWAAAGSQDPRTSHDGAPATLREGMIGQLVPVFRHLLGGAAPNPHTTHQRKPTSFAPPSESLQLFYNCSPPQYRISSSAARESRPAIKPLPRRERNIESPSRPDATYLGSIPPRL